MESWSSQETTDLWCEENTIFIFLWWDHQFPIKKQYDGYVIYWSRRSDSGVHSYCGLLFVGCCTAVDLVEHYEEFVKQLDIDCKFLLNFGMDRPNINLSFEDKLTQTFSEVDASFLKLDHVHSIQFILHFRRGLSSFFRGQVPSATSNREERDFWSGWLFHWYPFLF